MSRLNIDQTYRFAWGAANTNYTFIIGFKKRNSKTLTLIDCFYCLKSMTWRTIDLTFLFISIITSGLKGLNFLQNSPWLALGNHWLVKHLPQKKKKYTQTSPWLCNVPLMVLSIWFLLCQAKFSSRSFVK